MIHSCQAQVFFHLKLKKVCNLIICLHLNTSFQEDKEKRIQPDNYNLLH